MCKVTSFVVSEIVCALSLTNSESGGLLGSTNNEVVDVFWFDAGKSHSNREYVPNMELWEQQLLLWNEKQIRFCGIIHSHDTECTLSKRDVNMARKILKINSLSSIYMPILYLKTKEILWYKVSNNRVKEIDVKVIKL